MTKLIASQQLPAMLAKLAAFLNAKIQSVQSQFSSLKTTVETKQAEIQAIEADIEAVETDAAEYDTKIASARKTWDKYNTDDNIAAVDTLRDYQIFGGRIYANTLNTTTLDTYITEEYFGINNLAHIDGNFVLLVMPLFSSSTASPDAVVQTIIGAVPDGAGFEPASGSINAKFHMFSSRIWKKSSGFSQWTDTSISISEIKDHSYK